MPTQCYAVTQPPIETLFTWLKSGEIAIPEIQRPFVWNATRVRNLLDSLFKGYPVGYLIAWRNPDVKLKDGTSSSNSPVFRVFQAAQVKLGDRGFLSCDITARELIEIKCDVHHIFPRDYLKKQGLTRGQLRQLSISLGEFLS